MTAITLLFKGVHTDSEWATFHHNQMERLQSSSPVSVVGERWSKAITQVYSLLMYGGKIILPVSLATTYHRPFFLRFKHCIGHSNLKFMRPSQRAIKTPLTSYRSEGSFAQHQPYCTTIHSSYYTNKPQRGVLRRPLKSKQFCPYSISIQT